MARRKIFRVFDARRVYGKLFKAARRECRRVDAAPGIKYDAAPTLSECLPNDFSALGQPALNTQNEEIEVKFVLDDLAAMRRRVVDMGRCS